MKLPTRLLMAAAAAALLSLTAACGAGGTTDSDDRTGTSAQQESSGRGETSAESGAGGGTADKATVCRKAQQALQDFGQQAAAAGGDYEAFNKAVQTLSTELKGLADQSEGDLHTALSSMATTWGSFKIDSADPVGSATKVLEGTKEAGEQAQKLVNACS